MNRLRCDFDVKFASGAAEGTFSGYAAVFGNIDAYGDVIERGAFKRTLREWEDRGKLPPMLLQHGGFFGGGADDLLPIGKWTEMEENSKGLRVEGQLFALDTERGRYIYDGLKAGVLDGLSIGYRARKWTSGTAADEPRRRLEEIDLMEASIVTFPANDKARIGSVKAMLDDIKTLADAERLLREAGGFWSKKTATDFVSIVARIARREAGDDRSVNGLLAQLRSVRRAIVPTS